MRIRIILLLFFTFSFLQANPTNGVLDQLIHKKNQMICSDTISKKLNEMKNFSSEEKAKKLSCQIKIIAQELMNQGFDFTIYSYGISKINTLFYSSIVLWEGKQEQPPIPLSLFIYGWPPEEYAKRNQTPYLGYATPIHSHPISCAFTILRGTIVQELFFPQFPLKSLKAKKIKEEILQQGQVIIDSPKTIFVHRMICRDKGQQAALSLHAYGLATAYQVKNIFHLTAPYYTYSLIKE